MKGKKAEIVSNQTVAVIIAVLILASVVMFLFKTDINTYLRNVLPGYHYDESGKDVDYTAKDGQIASNCNYKVAKIVGTNIYFCENGKCDVLKPSKLLFTIRSKETVVEVDQLNNDDIGRITGGKLYLFSDVFDFNSKLYKEVKDDLPPISYLLNLQGSILSNSGGNFLCREKSVEQENLQKQGVDTSQINLNGPMDMTQVFSDLNTAKAACTQYLKVVTTQTPDVEVKYKDSEGKTIEGETCSGIIIDGFNNNI